MKRGKSVRRGIGLTPAIVPELMMLGVIAISVLLGFAFPVVGWVMRLFGV